VSFTPSPLLTRWLDSVNQPVVDNVQFLIDSALNDITDGGNFPPTECRDILREIVESTPPIKP